MSTGNDGFIKLFDLRGREVSASRDDLLKIEAQSYNTRLYRRVTNDTAGTYWLVSNRPGVVSMVLKIHLFYPPSHGTKWSVALSNNGIASYPEFDISAAIASFLGSSIGTPIPDNVARLAQAHVAYDANAKDPGTSPLKLSGIRTLLPIIMHRRLSKVTNKDTQPLIDGTGGRLLGIFELQLRIVGFTADNNMGYYYNYLLMYAMVPIRSWPRLTYLQLRFWAQKRR